MGELLAVALILDDAQTLAALDYTSTEALERLRFDIGEPSVAAAAKVFDALRAHLTTHKQGRTPVTQPVNDTCQQIIDGKRTCGHPVTDEVSWPDYRKDEYPTEGVAYPGVGGFDLNPDGTIRRTATYPHRVVNRVCASCADWLMGPGADWLGPTRKPL
jgi:hypothetical protein